VPVTVEYAVTPLGQTLSATVDSLRIWAETHMEQVLRAQQQYDAGMPQTGVEHGADPRKTLTSRAPPR
jgi:hypothetical protein